MASKVIFSLFGLLVIAAAISAAPDFVRYMKIRSM
jgi:hypothetical protein